MIMGSKVDSECRNESGIWVIPGRKKKIEANGAREKKLWPNYGFFRSSAGVQHFGAAAFHLLLPLYRGVI